ncbi:MAG TPA: TlpA disulfide reductase family protein [Streptosporangiaceae bacterium]
MPVRAWRVRLVRGLAAIAAGAVLVAGCTSGPSASKTASTAAGTPGTTVFTGASALRTPAISGNRLGGGKLSLASYRGHAVVLDFWGSWCTVCQQEAPDLSAIARHFATSKVVFLGVDVADSTASAHGFMKHFRISYQSFYDPSNRIAPAFRGFIPPTAFPSTLVISPAGRITARIIGAVSSQRLTELIGKAARLS